MSQDIKVSALDGKVVVYSKTTGRKQRIPRHWLDHPVLGADFQLTPKSQARAERDATPTKKWTITQLEAHAVDNGIDLNGVTGKDAILAAVLAGPHPPADDPATESGDDPSTDQGDTPPTTEGDTPSSDNTPASRGEE